MIRPISPGVRRLIEHALDEDVASGDVTTDLLFENPVAADGSILAGEDLVVSGLYAAEAVFHAVDPSVRFRPEAEEGSTVKNGGRLARVEGDGASLLRAERTAINFLQHLSGIATWTARFVRAVEGTRCRILDTRKTLPGLRELEKAAVRHGGGWNHRFNLADGILIKDNHLALFDGSPAAAVRKARDRAPHRLRVEVEAETLDQVRSALDAGAEAILLDNMSPALVTKAVALIKGRAVVGVSGGIRLDNVREFALAGADAISIGALTHSAPAVDIGFEVRRAS